MTNAIIAALATVIAGFTILGVWLITKGADDGER